MEIITHKHYVEFRSRDDNGKFMIRMTKRCPYQIQIESQNGDEYSYVNVDDKEALCIIKVIRTTIEQNPVAFEWHNHDTGHCYVDYTPHPNMDEADGYVKTPLYN